MYRHRSTPRIFSGLVQVSQNLFGGQPRYGPSLRRPVRAAHGRRDPALADAALDHGFRLWLQRHKFGDGATAVGDDHRLALGGTADIFAELVLEGLQTDGS